MTYPQGFNYASAAFAFLAAALWFWASRAEVESDFDEAMPPGATYLNFHGSRGPIQIKEDGKRIDVVETLALQSKLNSYAAMAACAAALLQGVAMALPQA